MQKTKIQKLRWHKQKFFIRCIAWLTILSFLIVLLLMGFPIVSDASDNDSKKLSDFYFCDSFLNSVDAAKYTDYSIDTSNYPFTRPFLDTVDASFYSKFFDFTPSDLGINGFTPENYNLYFFYNTSDDSNYIVLISDDSIHYDYDSFGRFEWRYTSSFSSYKVNEDFTLTRVDFDSNQDGFKMVYGSSAVSNSGFYGNFNLNYLYLQNKMGKGEGGYKNPDTSILDNMYLNQGSGLVLSSSSLNNGKLYIVALPNITQHKEDYSIRLTASGAVNFTPKSNVSLFLDGYNVASAFGITINKTHDRNFTLASNDGDFVDIPLSSFNNGFYEYDLSSLNATTRVNGGFDSPYSDLAKYLSSNVNKWSNALYPITSYIGGAKSVGVESYSVSVPEIINNVNDLTKIVVNSAYCDYSMQIVDKQGNSSQGVITYHADFVNPSNSSNIIDTLTRTPEQISEKTTPDNSYNYSPQYPYKPNDNNSIIYPDSSQNNDNSSNSNNNVTVSGGDNSVINNVTVTQNDKYPQKGVMTSFLKIINQDKNDAVKYIGDTSGINGYLHLMQVSMSWIPQEVWSVWISYLKAILGICVGAFFLKILVNWST